MPNNDRPTRNVPSHYLTSGGKFDVIDICKYYALNFNRGNVVKYLCRAGRKVNELQDLYKAKEYIEREIQFHEEMMQIRK